MLTTTATFDIYRKKPNAKANFLLTIAGENPSRTFYLSDDRITLSTSGEKFQGLVTSWGSIKQTIDLFSKKANVGNIKIKLNNAHYKQSSSGGVSISDDLNSSDIINRIANIYVWFEGITDLGDCLKVFEGFIQPLEKTTPESVTIPLIDATLKKHLLLPQNFINTTDWPDAPEESVDKPIPLVYGTHNFSKDSSAPNGGGAIEGIWVSSNKVLIADHVMDAITNVWLYDEDLDEFAEIDSGDYTVNLDDSGQATISFDELITPLLTAYIYPDSSDITHNDDPKYTLIDSERLACYDRDSSTYMEGSAAAYPANGNQDDTHEDLFYGRFKNTNPVGNLVSIYLQCRYAGDFNGSRLLNGRVHFWHDDNSANIGEIIIEGAGDSGVYTESDITTPYITSAGRTLQDIQSANAIKIQVKSNYLVGVELRYKILEIYDVRLKIQYTRTLETKMRIFVEGSGREYGSWIDDGGRSGSYNEGDLIENPAHIIESILRDEMGLANADIDTGSFDTAQGDLTSWDLAVKIKDVRSSVDIFMEICRQARLNFMFSSDGLAKVSIIDDSPTSADDDLLLNDIQKKKIFLDRGKIKSLINKIRIEYDASPLDGKLQAVTDAENTTSQGDYGITKEVHIKAPGINTSAVASMLEDHYVDTDGFWKDLKEILAVTMVSFEKSHWEVGDIIEPNDDINAVLKNYNISWGTALSSPLLMIIEKIISPKEIKFKLIRVGTTPDA